MKRTTKWAAGLGLALSLGFAASALNAHPFGYGPGPMMGYGAGPGCAGAFGGGPGYGFGPGAAGSAAEVIENRLAGVKSELKITPAQESAWNAYVEEAKRQADSRRKWMITMHESRTASLPERAELRDNIWKQLQAQSESMTAKLKDLYAVLTPEQKSLADQYLAGFGPRAGFGPGYRYR